MTGSLRKTFFFSDETHFHLSEFVNKRNRYIQGSENSRQIQERGNVSTTTGGRVVVRILGRSVIGSTWLSLITGSW